MKHIQRPPALGRGPLYNHCGIMKDMTDIDVDQAKWLAKEFGVKTKAKSATTILEAMIEEGITFEMMEDTLKRKPVDEEAPTFTKKDPVVLVRMRRMNPSFQFRSYKFTKDHPFALMTEDDADAIMTLENGFSRATVQEAEQYYGRS